MLYEWRHHIDFIPDTEEDAPEKDDIEAALFGEDTPVPPFREGTSPAADLGSALPAICAPETAPLAVSDPCTQAGSH